MRRVLFIAAVAALITGCVTGNSIKRQSSGDKSIYVVKRGETLQQIAEKFETTPEAIKKANKLKWGNVTRGQRLVIPPPTKEAPAVAKDIRKGKRQGSSSGKVPRIKVKLIWPVDGKVTSKFGKRGSGKHDGIDVSGKEGAKIVSSANGKVMFSGEGPTGYGLIVVIRHTDELITVYAHNSKNLVKKGQSVKQGQPVALVGHTGRATGNHVHFEVRVNRIPRNPVKYLPKR